jgi:hypothetical protein
MRHKFLAGMAVAVLAVAIAGCAGKPPPPDRHEEEWHAPVNILLRYAEPDGRVTRTGLEAGLRKDFAAADANRDGVLQADEARAVNAQRWTEDQSAISPLQDWNGDGVIDFNEFAATARTLFRELDRNGNGVLTQDELRPERGGAKPPGGDREQPNEDRRGGGRGGGGRGGGPPGGGGGPPGSYQSSP